MKLRIFPVHLLIATSALVNGAQSDQAKSYSNESLPAAEVEEIFEARSKKIEAAHEFAKTLGNADQAKSIQNFAAAYHLAESAGKAVSKNAARQPAVAVNPSVWQKAALSSEIFQGNFLKTLQASIQHKSVVGPPVPVKWRVESGQTTDAFTDCVAVGRAVGRDCHYYCSGTVIGKRVVLTAGHCANGEKVAKPNIVLIGPSINDGVTREVSKIICHPQLNLGRHPFNDVALLILKDPVPENVTIRTVAKEEQLYQSFQVTVAGFGVSKADESSGFGLKRSTDVAIVTYDGSQPNGKPPFGCDLGLEFAASSLEIFRPLTPAPTTRRGNKAPPLLNDTCEGDSGGPAYVREGDGWVLAGATSRPIDNADAYVSPGEQAAECGDGGIYVRADRYWSEWIKPTIANEHLD